MEVVIDEDKINVGKGVHQGDNISTKLFTWDWRTLLNSCTGKIRALIELNHLHFADGNVIVGSKYNKLKTMLEKTQEVSKQIRLKMNLKNTILIITEDTVIITASQALKDVNE